MKGKPKVFLLKCFSNFHEHKTPLSILFCANSDSVGLGEAHGSASNKLWVMPMLLTECRVRRHISLGFMADSNYVFQSLLQAHVWQVPCIVSSQYCYRHWCLLVQVTQRNTG